MSLFNRFSLLLKQLFDIVRPNLIVFIEVSKTFADDNAHHTAVFVENDCSIHHIPAFVICLS